MIRSSKLTRQATILQFGFCPMHAKSQRDQARLFKVELWPHALTLQKSDRTLSLVASSLFFQGNEIHNDAHPRHEKDDNHSSATDSIYDDDKKY